MALFGFVLSAQTIRYGVKVGYVRSNSSGFEPGYDASTGPDYTNSIKSYAYNSVFGGAFMVLPLSKSWDFQAEVLFVPEGFLEKGDITSPEGTSHVEDNYHLNYLQIPCLVKWKLSPDWSVNFGPLVNLLLSSSLANDDYATSTFSMGVVLGTDYVIKDHFLIDLRGQFSALDFDDYGSFEFGDDFSGRAKMNRVFQASLGYIF